MTFRLVQRRTVWCPTLLGWAGLFAIVCAPLLFWWFGCEAFLSRTHRLPATVLVVEGWIGAKGIHAAGAEFKRGGYQYIVTTGGLTNNGWGPNQWSYAEMAEEVLVDDGVPKDRIIRAESTVARSQRTFASAAAAWRTLRTRGLLPPAVNLFTLGAHARRSRLIYAKAFGRNTQVGIISWVPANYIAGPWWRSSDRAEDVIKETAGYFFEVLLNSGRSSNSPLDSAQTP